MRRNPLTLLFGLQLILIFQTQVDDAWTGLSLAAAAAVGLAMAILCTRDLRRHGVPAAWQYGVLVLITPLVGFLAYVYVRGVFRRGVRSTSPAASRSATSS